MTPRPKNQASRRERPAKPALTREGIVATAVAVLRAEGLEKVTMRRLAQELDTGPASLYVYVASTAELHAAVLDELLGEVDLDQAASQGDWRERVIGVLSSYITVLFAHPALARSALTVWPSGENYLRLLERLLALLDEGGVPPVQAAWGVDLLLQVATATAAEQSTRGQSGDADREWDDLTRALHEVDERTHPHLRALAASLLAGTPGQRRTWGFQVLLNGIVHTPAPHPDHSSHHSATPHGGTRP
ncbi:TetR/AcrR family transcriptional regulator [Goodfellowiella coeruleoviolacea]|uniref:Transcriptional regulator, TetR family n=1 Tax=Goodfellowiella coeruleoviolacea TaxID=334858 RepID=A0AAE3GAJ3_9PSEU|nr:TetR/AcrR family transcriptional regulator [Goodfellowiella coeruleoviolacea]MCP2163905.1 transcriptional regulator, TetR family [Goodfellowiella coeruleoviolacea]